MFHESSGDLFEMLTDCYGDIFFLIFFFQIFLEHFSKTKTEEVKLIFLHIVHAYT